MRTKTFQAQIEERYPEDPKDGDVAFRLVAWVDPAEPEYGIPSMPMYEFYIAVYDVKDVGGPGYGPRLSLAIGPWVLQSEGLGGGSLDELIVRYEHEKETHDA